MAMDAILALEDGRVFHGRSFGAPGERTGELIFNTSMTGYQEVLTDPSYSGQIVVMTYPQIGNYGVNGDDVESHRPLLEGVVVREYSPTYSNWRARESLAEYLTSAGIPAIMEVDTRAVVRHIRQHGAMRACISTEMPDPDLAVAKAREAPSMIGRDLASLASCSDPYTWNDDSVVGTKGESLHVVAYDFGAKHNILRTLAGKGCRVSVVPAHTPAEVAMAMHPDGVFLSNGPGDPQPLVSIISNVRALMGQLPLFGICLGHQILGLAVGARTYKLKFGHRGGNHPVKNLLTGRVEITTQNHSFAVDARSLPGEMEVTHINLNDGTLEGMRHRNWPIFSVQYHPEASPGPHDSLYLFDEFINAMKRNR